MGNDRYPVKPRSLSRTYLKVSLMLIAFLSVFIAGAVLWMQKSLLANKEAQMQRILSGSHLAQMKKEASLIRQELNGILARSGRKTPGSREEALMVRILEKSQSRSLYMGFLISTNETVIYHPELKRGERLPPVYDWAGHSMNRKLIDTASLPEGGILDVRLPDEGQPGKEKLVYVVKMDDGAYILGLSLDLALRENIIAENRREFRQSFLISGLAVLFFEVLFLLLAILLFLFIARRVESETRLFIDFFRNDSVDQRKLDLSLFHFTEFQVLGEYANRMNNEMRLQRDKLLMEINEKRQTEAELLKFSSAIEQSSMMVMIADLEGKIEYVNAKFTDVTGYEMKEVFGKSAGFQRTPGSTADYHQLWEALKRGRFWEGEFYNRRKDGDAYWEAASISPMRGLDGKITHYLKVASDVTERKHLEKNLEFMAHHDTLTGLPNRLLFSDRLGVALALSRRNETYTAVMILDLDNFKTVNDTLGHDAGDILLKMVVSRFKLYIREQDTASRMGGDEFNFILSSLPEKEDGIRIAKRIVESFQRPFDISGHSMLVTASLGMAFYPSDGDTPDKLLKHADQALYMAKDRGKNNVQVFQHTGT